MYSLLAYIIQVNILLAIIYLGYYGLLKRLTFYGLNRGVFLIGAVFSFVYPFWDIKSLFRKHVEPVGEWMGYLPDFYAKQVAKSIYTLENVIYSCIAVVGLWFAVRLCLQLLSLLRIHIYSRKTIWKTYWYQNVLFPIVPFSFLNKIYLHKEQHEEPELHDIFEHEDIHVKGLHSLDILMFEILLIVCWYNPFVWLMRRAVRQNLEYLTDQQVLNKGVDRQTYQYSLLNVSKQGASLGVSSQFNFKFLKKRIMMMNKKKSSKLALSKYAFLLPIVIFSAGAFTISKADEKIIQSVEVVRDIKLDPIKTQDVSKSETKVIDTIKAEQDTVIKKERLQESVAGTLNVTIPVDDEMASEKGGTKSVPRVEVRGVVKNPGDTTRQPSLTLRGLEADAEPMYIIDGKIQPEGRYAMDALDPNQIESISVLKDESSTSLYGDKGKNGVLVITTKHKKGNNTEGLRVWGIQAPEPLKNPGYVVDGLMVSKEEYAKIDESEKKSIVTLSKKEVENYVKFYNRSIDLGTHDGVVMVTTK